MYKACSVETILSSVRQHVAGSAHCSIRMFLHTGVYGLAYISPVILKTIAATCGATAVFRCWLTMASLC